MSIAPILPTDFPGVQVEFLRALNDRFRELSGSSSASSTAAGSSAGLFFTHANRPDANGTPVGTFGTETDRGVTFQVQTVSSKQVWVYASGTMYDTLANRPADLGTNDAGFQFCASDEYDYRWSGSAWAAPGGGRQILAARPAFKASTTSGTQPARYGKLWNDDNGYVSLNISFDGTNWNLDDTSKAGTVFRLTAGGVDVFTATAGANPRALTTTFTVDASGNLNIPGVYKKGGTQVVAARQANIPVVTVGGTTDANARATIASILGLLQTHGLMT